MCGPIVVLIYYTVFVICPFVLQLTVVLEKSSLLQLRAYKEHCQAVETTANAANHSLDDAAREAATLSGVLTGALATSLQRVNASISSFEAG